MARRSSLPRFPGSGTGFKLDPSCPICRNIYHLLDICCSWIGSFDNSKIPKEDLRLCCVDVILIRRNLHLVLLRLSLCLFLSVSLPACRALLSIYRCLFVAFVYI